MAIQKIKLNNVPFQGGVDTAHEIALLETGSFSQLQNVRPTRPGFLKRLGQSRLHTTTDSAQEITNLYQFNKGPVTERHFFAQRVDGSLIEGTNNPPTATTGNFGTEKLSAATGSAPASFGNLNDMMVYSDGARQHHIYPGDTQKVLGAHVYKDATSIPDIPLVGEDYTAEANDGQTTTIVDLSSLGTLATFDCFFVITPVRANKITFTMTANVNTVASVMKVHYRNSTGGWTELTNGTHGWVDGTISSGKTVGQTGSVTWTTMPTDEVPHFSFDKSGFIYRVSVSVALSVSVTASAISFGGPIQEIQNVWDGIMPDVPEARVYDVSKGTYATYAGTSVDLSALDNKSATVTMTIATPCVVTWTAHGHAINDSLIFSTSPSTTGALPTGLIVGTIYYIITAGFGTNSFQISDSLGGSAINTSGTQAGTHTATSQSIRDYIYLLTPDPVIGFYASPGAKPNASTGEIVGTDIAFVDGGTDRDSITRTTADFITQGFEKGMSVEVSGSSTAANNRQYYLSNVSASTLTLQTGVVTAVAAGDTITIKRPDTTSVNYVNAINYAGVFTGADFTALTNLNDGTLGMSKDGFITFSRSTAAKKVNFQGAGLYAHVYKIGFKKKVLSNIIVSFQYLPFFDIAKTHYPIGQSNATWKGRACYAFKGFGNILYFSAKNQPMVLNGDDGIGRVEIGGGQKNDILCIRKFYNEILVWQAEKGEEGGTLTIVEGDKPTGVTGFQKLLISARYGVVNSKSAVVLEGVNIETMSRDKPVATVAFWISRDGVFKTNGVTFESVSQKIANYFDVTKSTDCIRRGYEDKHWMGYDRSSGVILIGLCTGTSAIKANKLFVLDPLSGEWITDVRSQDIYCFAEAEAESGNLTVVQVGGGADGYMFRINDPASQNDISTAVDASITVEINGKGNRIRVNQDSLRCKVQAAGSITRTIMADGNPAVKDTKTLVMTAKNTNDVYRRHFKSNKVDGDHLSVKWRHNTAAQSCHFLDFGVEVEEIETNPLTSDT